MKKFLLVVTILLLYGCQDIGDTTPLLGYKKKKQPIIIVNKNRHLNIAEFWIDRIKESNKVIMNSQDIKKFNDYIAHNQNLITYLEDIKSQYSGSWVLKSIRQPFNNILKQTISYSGELIRHRIGALFNLNLNLDFVIVSHFLSPAHFAYFAEYNTSIVIAFSSVS